MEREEKKIQKKQIFEQHLGDFLENSISKRMVQKDLLAPVLPDKPEKKTWYRVPAQRR